METEKRNNLLVGIGGLLLCSVLIIYFVSGKADSRYSNRNLAGVYDYIDSGQYDRTIPVLRQLRQKFPDDAEVFYASAWVSCKLHRYRVCLKMARLAVEKDPGMAKAQAILGAAYFKSSKLDRALDASRKALKSDPNLALPYSVIGNIYIRKRKVEEGIKLLKESVRLEPGNANFWNHLSSGYLKQKNLDEALEASQRALELDPTLGAAHFNIGLAYFHLEEPAQALKHLMKVEELYVEKRDKGWISQARYTKNIIQKKYDIKPEDIND